LLQNTKVHPTAAWVYEQLKKEFPKVSVASVYRNLNILVDEGAIKSISFEEPQDRFDANLSEHYHFICERCGAISDLEIPINRSLNKMIETSTQYTVHRHRIDFYGICRECKK
jgi:Fe2+ or Zn2+ uptake regulation protein